MSDQCSHHQKTIPTSGNTTGDDREDATGGIVGRKRSSPSSQTNSYKFSRPLVCTHPQQYQWCKRSCSKRLVFRRQKMFSLSAVTTQALATPF